MSRRGPVEPFAVCNTATEFVTVGLCFVPFAILHCINVHALEYGMSAPNIASH